MATGTRTVRKRGVVIEMTIVAVMPSRAKKATSLNDCGILDSIELKSLLNRFMIRPVGVDSKNDMPHRKTLSSIIWWRFRDAFTTIDIMTNSPIIQKKS